MAFSLIARDPRSGQIGGVICARSIAAGARVLTCATDAGAVLVQHRTDSRMGVLGLELLRAGHDAQQTVDRLVASTPHAHWRQIAVLDRMGNSAAWSGARCKAEVSEAPARDACAVGTGLAATLVSAAMLRAVLADPALPLAERLMLALEEGLAAGGNCDGENSAMLRVMDRAELALVDLRIDWDPAPVAALRALWTRFAPLAADLMLRATDPDNPAIRY